MRKFLFFILVSFFCINPGVDLFAQKEEKQKFENLADGPYIKYLPEGKVRIISAQVDGTVDDSVLNELPANFSFSVQSHSGKHKFDVTLHPIKRQAWKSTKPDKLLVVSDPHGKLDYFVSVLRGNNVINENYEWIFGKNHLMIIGDVFDRGKDVLPIFWLIYKLEKEAEQAGGQVSFLLGNHEPMVLAGDYRYMEKNYVNFAEKLGLDYRELFAPDTELGRWLLTRNTMQLIGNELFVHAGLSKEFLEEGLTIPQVNEEMSKGLFMTKKQRNDLSPLIKFLYGSNGPIWYRGMVRNDEKYNPLHVAVLEDLLKKYNANRIIVGHTIFPDIRTLYNGKVIMVNVDNKKNFDAVLGRGLLIEKKKTYIINDKGIWKELSQ